MHIGGSECEVCTGISVATLAHMLHLSTAASTGDCYNRLYGPRRYVDFVGDTALLYTQVSSCHGRRHKRQPLNYCLQVLLLSARNALLSRLVLQSRADPDNLKRFSRIAFGAYNNKSSSSSRSTEVMRAAAGDMLEGSGVPELEQAVLGFLFEAAAGVKLVAVLDDMGRLLTEVCVANKASHGLVAAAAWACWACMGNVFFEKAWHINGWPCVSSDTPLGSSRPHVVALLLLKGCSHPVQSWRPCLCWVLSLLLLLLCMSAAVRCPMWLPAAVELLLHLPAA